MLKRAQQSEFDGREGRVCLKIHASGRKAIGTSDGVIFRRAPETSAYSAVEGEKQEQSRDAGDNALPHSLPALPEHPRRLLRRTSHPSPTHPQAPELTLREAAQFSFEDVVLKGLASDGGLFIPEEIPSLRSDWRTKWRNYTFQELAYEIFSLYISPEEIPSEDLKDIIRRSYGTFRAKDITPMVTLDEGKKLHLLELFHGPTFAFKDVALQFVGNLFEYFLVRRNKDKQSEGRDHLTVIGATSGDTGSAAI